MSCYLRALEAGHRVEGECGVAVVAPRGVELGRQHRRERRLLQYEGYGLDNNYCLRTPTKNRGSQ